MFAHVPLASFFFYCTVKYCRSLVLGGKHVLCLGVEICFELYNPRIHEIQVVKLEKRLDDSLLYLRDALPEFSTFDVNMKPVPHEACQEVPVNKVDHVTKSTCLGASLKKHPAENLGNFCVHLTSPNSVLVFFSCK